VLAPLSWGEIKATEIMGKMDFWTKITTDVTSQFTITQQRVKQGTKIMKGLYYRRDKDDAFLIFFTAPDSDKGTGYLREGENMWFYPRNERKFQLINRNENVGGTDARAGDFEARKITELYEVRKDENGKEILREETLGKIPVYYLEVVAKVKDVTYPRKSYWVTRDKFLLLKEQSFAASGTLMQTAVYLKYTMINKKYFPLKQIFIDEFDKGNSTMLEISGISTDKIDDAVFTKAYLENLSK